MGASALVVLAVLVFLYVQVHGGPRSPSETEVAVARARSGVTGGAVGRSASPYRPSPGASGDDPWQRPPVEVAAPSRAAAVPAEPPPALQAPPELDAPPELAEPGSLDREMTLSERLAEANRLYDKKEYEEGQKLALDLLREDPENSRMLRIVVSTACAMGEEAKAREFHAKLKPRDKAQMKVRCHKYSIELPAE